MLLFLLNRLHYAFEKFIYFCYQQKKNCFYYLYYQVDLKVHLYNLLPPPLSTTIFIQMQAQILSASQLGNGQKHRSTHSLLHKVGPLGHNQHSSDIICLSARQGVIHPKTQTHSLLHKVGPLGHNQHSSDIICLSARQGVIHPKTQTHSLLHKVGPLGHNQHSSDIICLSARQGVIHPKTQTHSLLHKVGPLGHNQHSSDIICLSARQGVIHPKTQTLTPPPPPKKKLPLSLGSNPIFINFVKN